jgi:hypothetical protein
MITHTFFNKCNTIIENSTNNTGLNPVAELNAGDTLTRILIDFDLTKLREQVKNGEVNVENLTHKIKMTNCGTVTLPLFNDKVSVNCKEKQRAASFDIIAFRLPYQWDEGRGFDYQKDYVKDTHKIISTDCSNWFQARNDMEWDEYGVYSYNTLANDYLENFNINEDAIIIGRQHFDNGTENLELDITDYINQILSGKKDFNGIGLAFSPRFESTSTENRFISFFTNHTNTFFVPYLETINADTILDDRANFHVGITNRLYFFVTDNGEYVNLDEMPTCCIDETYYDVKHAGRGVYYIELTLKKGEVEPNTILYDTWSNLVLNGLVIEDVEMEFVVLPMDKRVNLGRVDNGVISYTPQLSGINDCEKIKIGDIREINVDFIEDYTHGKTMIPSHSEYRIYVKENDREIDIYPYQPIERRYNQHAFIVDTNELIPNTYYIDIKTKHGRSVKIFDNVLEFTIVSNVTNFYK